MFREWHLANGWADIGYHAVILNGRRSPESAYDASLDGLLEPSRDDLTIGAHCKADHMNLISLGVCLVGDPRCDRSYPTARQLDTLIRYLAAKRREYGIPISSITQHSDHEPAKPFCAGLDMEMIRRRVSELSIG